MQAHVRWGIESIFLEGAFTPLELSGYRSLGQSLDSRQLRDKLEKGQWTGAEWAAANLTDPDLRLLGMEDTALYRQALDASLEVQRHQARALEELDSMRRHWSGHGIKMTADDWKRMEHLLQLKARPQEMALYHRAAIVFPDELAHALDQAESFYRLADARSDVFVKRIGMPDKPVAVVVGGFHTTAMAQLLREQNISYVVVTPRVTEAPDPALYRARLQASANVLLTPSR
jgi:hypothetical protein